jgi:hypothetical protein
VREHRRCDPRQSFLKPFRHFQGKPVFVTNSDFGDSTDTEICAQIVLAYIIANEKERALGYVRYQSTGQIKRDIDRAYVEQGNDSVFFANWLYLTRKIFRSRSGPNRHLAIITARNLLLPTRFDQTKCSSHTAIRLLRIVE